MVYDFGIHEPEPERRKKGDEEHSEIPRWQLRGFFKMAQGLVPAGGMGVVIGMSLQLVKKDIGQDVIAVP